LQSHTSLLLPTSLPHSSFYTTRPPPLSTLFPYTTLFRSITKAAGPWANLAGVNGDTQLAGEGTTTRDVVISTTLTARVSGDARRDRKSTRLNSSHGSISYAVFCLKKKKQIQE